MDREGLAAVFESGQRRSAEFESAVDQWGDVCEEADQKAKNAFVLKAAILDNALSLLTERLSFLRGVSMKETSIMEYQCIHVQKILQLQMLFAKETTPTRTDKKGGINRILNQVRWIDAAASSVSVIRRLPCNSIRRMYTCLPECLTYDFGYTSAMKSVYFGFYPITRSIETFSLKENHQFGALCKSEPNDIDVDPITGFLYVTYPSSNTVSCINSDATIVNSYSLDEIPGLKKFKPYSIAIAPNGSRIVIGSTHVDKIAILDRGMKLLRIVTHAPEDLQISNPERLRFDRDGFLYVCEWSYGGPNKLRKFDEDGNYILDILNDQITGKKMIDGFVISETDTLVVAPLGRTKFLYECAKDGHRMADIPIERTDTGWGGQNSLCRGPNGGFVLCDKDARDICFYDADRNCVRVIQTKWKIHSCVFGLDNTLYLVVPELKHLISL